MKLLPFLLASTLAAASLPAGEIVLADFESGGKTWAIKGQGLALDLVTDPARVREGKAAGELIVNCAAPFSSIVSFPVPEASPVGADATRASLWIRGGLAPCKFQFSLVAADGGVFSLEQVVSGAEWQNLALPFRKFAFNRFAKSPPEAAQVLDPTKIRAFQVAIYPGLQGGEPRHLLGLDTIKLAP
jgi:hypothetical protein